MAHDHSDSQSYYLEQICTIALAGALGGVAVMWYNSGQGLFFLADLFHKPVLWAGIALLVLVVIRAVALWIAVGKPAARLATAAAGHEHCGHDHGCAHDHDHSHAHEHEHGIQERPLPSPAPAVHSHGAHDHDHDHSHSHGAGHSHGDHGHDHGWNPWRFAILLFPVVLYFMNLPNEGFGANFVKSLLGKDVVLGAALPTSFCPDVGIKLADGPYGDPEVAEIDKESPAAKEGIQVGDRIIQLTEMTAGNSGAKSEPVSLKSMPLDQVVERFAGNAGTLVRLTLLRSGSDKPLEVTLRRDEKVVNIGFLELEPVAMSPQLRQFYGGKRVRIKGQFMPGEAGNTFSLYRMKMICCGADARPLKMVIEAPENVSQFQPTSWVTVEGQVQFREVGNDTYTTVLKVSSLDKIKPSTPEVNPFLQ